MRLHGALCHRTAAAQNNAGAVCRPGGMHLTGSGAALPRRAGRTAAAGWLLGGEFRQWHLRNCCRRGAGRG